MAILNLPPGGPLHANLTALPTWLFTPVGSLPGNVRIYNEGRNIVYIGQANVTVNTGMPLPPGGKPLELVNVSSSLYAVSTLTVGSAVGTVTTTTTAGTNVFTITGGTFITAGLSTGATLVLQNPYNTAGSEAVVLSAFGTTPATFTATTNLQFAHDTTNLLYACTPTYGQVRVDASPV